MPLQASATSSVVFASTIVLPSRSTGMPAVSMQNDAVCAAKSCSGNAIAFITIAGSGIMNTRNAIGKASSRRQPGAEDQPHEPGDHDDQREALQEQLRADAADDEHQQAARQQHGPERRRPRLARPQRLAPLPDEVERERQDQEAVRVVLLGRPLPHERREHVRVERGERQDRRQGPEARGADEDPGGSATDSLCVRRFWFHRSPGMPPLGVGRGMSEG
jgi:hypothetical protein